MHLNSVFCSHKRNIRTISHTILLLFFFGFCIYVINEHRYNLNQDYYKKKNRFGPYINSSNASRWRWFLCVQRLVCGCRCSCCKTLWQMTMHWEKIDKWVLSCSVFFYFVLQMEHQIYIKLWVCKNMYTRFPQHDIEYMYLLINHMHIKN